MALHFTKLQAATAEYIKLKTVKAVNASELAKVG